MNKTLRERFVELWKGKELPPTITENSSLQEIAIHYPHVFEFVERRYGLKVDSGEKALTLREFSEKFTLPPAQILFMEIQMALRTQGVRTISPKEAKHAIDHQKLLRVLDVREDWEMKLCKIPRSEPLTPQLLDEILTHLPKETPILLYCHFGIRSLDAATFLADRGFTNLCTLSGGIDAWALEVDPKIPRYENAWC